MGWHEGPLVGFDLETTGTDASTSRIVTAAVTEVHGGTVVRRRAWLVDPGVPIPAEAAGIHGVTTERARLEGRPAPAAVAEIADTLTAYWSDGVPVVAYNAPFDLSLLVAEVARHGLPPLDHALGPVIDPLTLDRALDRFRKGKRTLEAACKVYGVVLDGAHDAGADALAAVGVARALAVRYPRLAALEPWELHRSQVIWYREWASGYQAWLRRERDGSAVVDAEWPLRSPAVRV